MDHGNIKTLNTLLKGEHMAIHAFDDVLGILEDPSLKNEFYQMQRIHKENAMRLSDRIIQLGGHPQESQGFAGLMAEAMLKIKTSLRHHPQYVINTLAEGEDKGIQAAQEAAKGNLDQESAVLVEDILRRDRSNAARLRELSVRYQ